MTTLTPPASDFAPVIERLKRDTKIAAATLTPREARYLVDSYYQWQDNRIRAEGQRRAMEGAEPHAAVDWVSGQAHALERRVASLLDSYSASDPLGVWARKNLGVGPVISAGLLAHIDIARAPTAGHIWSLAGLVNANWCSKADASKWIKENHHDDLRVTCENAGRHFNRNPSSLWKMASMGEDGEPIQPTPATLAYAISRRPFNAELKCLTAFKLGECFVKVCNKEGAYYGNAYAERKAQEIAANERGEFADQASAKLEKYRIGKGTDAFKHYSAGRLPPAHIHARARRWAVKLFLSHYHHVGTVLLTGEAPPMPYAIANLGHAHYLKPPHFD